MEKLKKMIFKLDKDNDYIEYLKCLTKDELDYIRKTLKVKGVSKLKKEELAQVLCNTLQKDIEIILENNINNEAKSLFNSLLKNNGSLELNEEIEESALNLRNLGLAFFVSLEDKSVIIMPKEIISRLSNNDNKLEEDKKEETKESETKVDDEVTKVTCGLLYFYGVMNEEELYKAACSLIKGNLNYDEYLGSLKQLCEVEKKIKFKDGFYCHNGVMDLHKIKKAHNERKDISFYRPSLEQVLEASSEDYILWNETIQTLHDVIKSNPKLRGEDDKQLVNICMNLIKNGFNFMEILTYLSQFIAFTSMEEGNKFIIAMQQLEKNCRLWVLKGNTPEDIVDSKKKSLDENTELKSVTKVKIGRNEPCICGSGKKYKKCCGKN